MLFTRLHLFQSTKAGLNPAGDSLPVRIPLHVAHEMGAVSAYDRLAIGRKRQHGWRALYPDELFSFDCI